jgi:BirA family biotin operon repressor/biotin-[acetyl-CoA-carboxylase] ligase
MDGRVPPFVVLGTGINVHQGPEDFPPELRYRATSVRLETGGGGDLEALAGGHLAAVDRLYRLLLRGGAEEMLALWKGYSRSHIGWRVRVAGAGPAVEGRSDGLGADGSLRVALDDGRTVSVLAGEVTILGRAAGE